MNLREETEAAELRTKLSFDDEATTLARWNTKLLDLEALELDRNLVRKCNLLQLQSRALPHLSSRVRPGQQPVCPLPRLTFSGDSLQFQSRWNKPGVQICRWQRNGQSCRKHTTKLRQLHFPERQEERHQAQLAAMAASQPATRPQSLRCRVRVDACRP